jgi:hypothetical protein
MAKKRSKPSGTARRGRKAPPTPSPAPSPSRGGTVTSERAARLHKMLKLLGTGAKTRAALIRRLKLDVRGFYRDLELLRGAEIDVLFTDGLYSLGEPLDAANIPVSLQERGYVLEADVDTAVSRLPFPDPHLTLGEAQLLAKGRSAAHKKMKQQIDQIMK